MQDFTSTSPAKREKSIVQNNLDNNAWDTENLAESWLDEHSFGVKSPLCSCAKTSVVDIASNGFVRNCYDA